MAWPYSGDVFLWLYTREDVLETDGMSHWMLSFRTREKMAAAQLESVQSRAAGCVSELFQGVARAVRRRTRQVCRNSALYESRRLPEYIELGVKSEQQVVVCLKLAVPLPLPRRRQGQGRAVQCSADDVCRCRKVYGTTFETAHFGSPRRKPWTLPRTFSIVVPVSLRYLPT